MAVRGKNKKTPGRGNEVGKTRQMLSPHPAPVLTPLLPRIALGKGEETVEKGVSARAPCSCPKVASCEGLLPLLWASPHHTSWEGGDFCEPRGGGAPALHIPGHPPSPTSCSLGRPGLPLSVHEVAAVSSHRNVGQQLCPQDPEAPGWWYSQGHPSPGHCPPSDSHMTLVAPSPFLREPQSYAYCV